MAPKPNEYHSGGGGSSQKPSVYHQYNIDEGTEMFRKKLEGNTNTKNERVLGKAPVQGGLPPHLLRQSKQGSSTSNAQRSGTQQPDRRPQHAPTPPRHTQDHHTRSGPSESYQTYQSQPRPFQTVTAEAHGPSQACGVRYTYDSAPTGPAPIGKQTIRKQQSRPQPVPTPPMERFDAPVGRASHSNNVAFQQQHPPTPTYGGNRHGQTGRGRVVFMPARDAPGTHPALKGIMSSRWHKEVLIPDISPDQESFPCQGQHMRTRQQSTTPQQHSFMRQPERSTPFQEWSASGRDGGVRLSTSPYQGQQAQITAVVQHPSVIQSQSMALVQQAHNASQPEKKKKWRPKHSVDLESQSLPTSVSSVWLNDDNIDKRDVGSDVGVADNMNIQGKIAAGLELIPERNGKGFPKKKEPYPQDYHTDGAEDAYTQGLHPSNCRDWVASLPDEQPPIAWVIHSNFEGSEECDLQPHDGNLMVPVDYPPTHINPKDNQQPGVMSRRLCSTAKLRSAVDFEKNKRRLENGEKKNREQDLGDPASHWQPVADPFPAPQPTPPPTQPKVCDVQVYSGVQGYVGTNSHTAVQAEGNNLASQALVGPIMQENNQEWESYVKVPCFMRPAQLGDLPQVLDIYNWEVAHGIQALDNKPLCLQDIQKVFQQCKSAQTPFIVMIAGTPAEAAMRKETPAPPRGPYQSYHQGPYQRSQKPEQDNVLGFGFINILTTGLAGDANHNVGRFQGQAYFFVANGSRRNGIGRALMTRLAQCCSIYTVTMGEYEWYDPDRTAACDTVAFNARNYSRLFIETASRSKTDPDTLWLAKLLDSEHFFCVCTMDHARKVGDGDNGIWLDKLIWQLDCQDPKSIKENVKKWH